MFPIDDGSKPSFNVSSQRDVDTLLADPGWAAGYREAVALAARAWGWDVDAAARVAPAEPGMGWTDWDIRLSKIIRSAWPVIPRLCGIDI